MKQVFLSLMILITAGIHADSYGDIGLSAETRIPYSATLVFPTEIVIETGYHTSFYPTDMFSVFLDAESAAGVSLAGFAADPWFTESTVTADGSLQIQNLVFRLGTELYVYSETSGTSLFSAEPLLSVTGGGPAVSWWASISGPVSVSESVEAHLIADTGLSISAGSSIILEPSLIFTSPNIPGASLRMTWFATWPAAFDTELIYIFHPDGGRSHSLSWIPSLSIFLNILSGLDLTIGAPGSLDLTANGEIIEYAIKPFIQAGVPLGSASKTIISLGSEFTTVEDPFAYLSASIIYSY